MILFNIIFNHISYIFSKALKQYKTTFQSDEEMNLINEEIRILKNINNDFILKYFDSFVESLSFSGSKVLYLVTEFSRVCIFSII